MKTWQIGCYTRPWAKHDYRVAFDAIAEAGFKFVGLMTTNSKSRLVLTADHTSQYSLQVGEEAKKRGLQIVSTYGGFRLWYDPGNILYYSNGKRDPALDAESVPGVVSGMCIKDYRHPKRVDVTPGTGLVDFPAVLAHLGMGGFTHGPLVVETLAPGGRSALQKEAKKARLFVEKLTGQKG